MQPGLLGSGVSNDGDIMRMIQDLQRQVRELAAANPFATMGLTPLPNALQVDGELDVKGPLSVDGTATFGGTTTIGGNAAITGTLSLPAGIINNAALSAPVYPVAYHADIQNITITSGPNVEKLRIDVGIPAGYTQALVSLTATMNMTNNSGNTDTAYLGANINGTSPGWAANGTAANSAVLSLSNTVALLVTGLSGGTFPLSGTASTGVGTWTGTGSVPSAMNLNATVLFLR